MSLDLAKPDAGASPCGSHFYGSIGACLQQAVYGRYLGLHLRDQPPGRAAGALFHIGAMNYNLARMEAKSPSAAEALGIAAMRQAPAPLAPAIMPALRAFGRFSSFESRRAATGTGPMRLAVERAFMVAVGPSRAPYSARFDLVEASRGGALVNDYKTHGRPLTKSLIREYSESLQVVGAFVIADTLFHLPLPVGLGLSFVGFNLVFVATADGNDHDGVEVVPVARPSNATVAAAAAEIEARRRRYADLVTSPTFDPHGAPRSLEACRARYGCDFWNVCHRGQHMIAPLYYIEAPAPLPPEFFAP